MGIVIIAFALLILKVSMVRVCDYCSFEARDALEAGSRELIIAAMLSIISCCCWDVFVSNNCEFACWSPIVPPVLAVPVAGCPKYDCAADWIDALTMATTAFLVSGASVPSCA